jgi:hypothetical protein
MISSERLASTRFFFNLVSDTEVIWDEEGISLLPEGDVVSSIIHALADLHQDGLLASTEWQDWQMVITDCAGQTRLSIALGYPDWDTSLALLN